MLTEKKHCRGRGIKKTDLKIRSVQNGEIDYVLIIKKQNFISNLRTYILYLVTNQIKALHAFSPSCLIFRSVIKCKQLNNEEGAIHD